MTAIKDPESGDPVRSHEPRGYPGLAENVPEVARDADVADDFDALVQLACVLDLGTERLEPICDLEAPEPARLSGSASPPIHG